MPDYTYKALGPLTPGSQRADLGLQIDEYGRAEPVVLVWLPDYASKDADLRVRVIRENERATVLEHPNIVKVHGLESVGDKTARVVEFSDGEPLRKILLAAGGKLTPELATRIVVDACTGVHYAHEAGNDDGTPMLHGDIRPETVMVGFNGVTKVSGYGALVLAPKEFEGQRRLHVAPEQVIGGRDAMNRQTDVYLLGLLLHECLTGKVPFADAPDFEQSVLTDPLQFLSPAEVPPELARIIDRALTKKAAQRFETPLALKAALEQSWPVATQEQLAAELSRLIPETDELRRSRKSAIDSGIAALARQQWKTRVPTGSTPAKGTGSASPLPPPPPPPAPVDAAAPTMPPRRVAPPPPVSYETGDNSAVSQVSQVRPPPSRVGPIVAVGAVIALGVIGYLIYSNAPPPKPAPVKTAVVVDAGAPIVAAPVDAGAVMLAAADAAAASDAGMLAAAPVDAGSATATATSDDGETDTEGDGAPGLDIETGEDVTILLDDKEIGVGAANVKTTPGKHVLKLVDKDGRTMRKAIWIPEKGTRKMKLGGGKAYVTIDAPEGSLVKIDGKSIGYAPIRGQVPVMSGPHEIEVMVGKAKWEESFNVRDGQKIHFNVGKEHR